MKKSFKVGIAVGAIVGVLASIPISYALINVESFILPQVNLVEAIDLVVTLILAVSIPIYIQTQVDNKKVIKELIVKDIEALIRTYCDNTAILTQLKQGTITLETSQEKVRSVFHRGDLIVDGITEQLKGMGISKDEILITAITEPYYKYLTDGNLYEASFVIDKGFIHAHEIQLRKMTTKLKMVVQMIILK